jgi:predicted SAM-dependent methyltransferase
LEVEKRMKVCLNIGCGADYRESTEDVHWTNWDGNPSCGPDILGSIEYPPQHLFDACDEIVANDILEHIPYNENEKGRWKGVLQRWIDCLKPGGIIRIQVPGALAVFTAYTGGLIDEETFLRVVYGESTNLFDRHYQMFSMQRLKQALTEMGMEIVEQETLHVCIIVVARKQ